MHLKKKKSFNNTIHSYCRGLVALVKFKTPFQPLFGAARRAQEEKLVTSNRTTSTSFYVDKNQSTIGFLEILALSPCELI